MYTFTILLIITRGALGITLDISAEETPENVIKDTHASPDISHVMFIPLGDMPVIQVNDGQQVIWKGKPGQSCAHFRVYSLYGEKRLAHAKIVKITRNVQETPTATKKKSKSRRRSESEVFSSAYESGGMNEPIQGRSALGKESVQAKGTVGRKTRLFSESSMHDQRGAVEMELLHFENLHGCWTYLTKEMYNDSFLKLQTERRLDLAKPINPIVFSKSPCPSVAGEALMIVPYTKFCVKSVLYDGELLWSSDRINYGEGRCEYAVISEHSIISGGTLEDLRFVKLYVRHGTATEHLHFYKMGKEWSKCSPERFSHLLMEHGENVEETKF